MVTIPLQILERLQAQTLTTNLPFCHPNKLDSQLSLHPRRFRRVRNKRARRTKQHLSVSAAAAAAEPVELFMLEITVIR